MSHIAGLVATGEHPSPIDVAHVTTTSTYKQLYGSRGGLILIGTDAGTVLPGASRTLAETVQNAVFPFFQGTPHLQAIAAKARALAFVATPEFKVLTRRIVEGAAALAEALSVAGYHVLTGGTDTHMVLVDVSRRGLTGVVAEQALEACGIVANKNTIAGDPHGPRVTSGLRFGTNVLAARGMDADAVRRCAGLVDQVLSAVRADGPREWRLDERVRLAVRAGVADLCARYPLYS
jgi:glycine hydroxymethyltransferase